MIFQRYFSDSTALPENDCRTKTPVNQVTSKSWYYFPEKRIPKNILFWKASRNDFRNNLEFQPIFRFQYVLKIEKIRTNFIISFSRSPLRHRPTISDSRRTIKMRFTTGLNYSSLPAPNLLCQKALRPSGLTANLPCNDLAMRKTFLVTISFLRLPSASPSLSLWFHVAFMKKYRVWERFAKSRSIKRQTSVT